MSEKPREDDVSFEVSFSELSLNFSPDESIVSSLSDNRENASISYTISCDESQTTQPPVYKLSSKRKMKECRKLDDTSGYSPITTSLLKDEKVPQKRVSELFRETIAKIDSSIALQTSPSGSSVVKDLSLIDLSIESNKENISSLSIDDKNLIQNLNDDRKTRFSEVFRSELSNFNIPSPDISFDMPKDSPDNSALSLEVSCESSKYKSIADGEANSVQLDNDIGSNHESDEDDVPIKTPATSSRKCHFLESSEEEISFEIRRRSIVYLADSEEDEEDIYENSFIDDEALEGESDNSSDIIDAICTTPSEDSETSLRKRQPPLNHHKLFMEADSGSEPEEDSVHMIPSELISSTPIVKKPPPTVQLYKTPDIRRRTCIATPLSVSTKTGTSGLPNRTYNRNILVAARELFKQYNENVFDSQLPPDMEIKLNKRLTSAAGRCVYCRKGTFHRAVIELSPKVVDCLERLKETLAHELCHAATFLIDRKLDNHGPVWKKWAARVNTKYPELPPVTRCHTYEIQYKFNYKCSEEWCKYKIGRHSKSIDLARALCPLCFSKLVLIESGKAPPKTPNKWIDFVKTRYNDVKDAQPARTPHKDIMKLLSDEFKKIKV